MPYLNVRLRPDELKLLKQYKKKMGYISWRDLLLFTALNGLKKEDFEAVIDPTMAQ